MMKKGFPRIGELVIADVAGINPNSISVRLKEYNAEGMVHISEVSRGWIRDIRRFVKPGQEIVARVLRSDGGLSLSMKRVSEQEKNGKIKSYRLELRAEKLLEMAGQALGIAPDQVQKEIGEAILEKFGSFHEVFKLVLTRPQVLAKHLPEKWIDAIADIAKKNISKKEFELKARLFIQTTSPDGIHTIKDTLKKAEKSGINIIYISAPEYLAKYSTKDPKKGIKDFESKLKKISSSMEGRYELVE